MDRVVSTSEVVELLGVGRSTLARWRRAGDFPEPVQLGPHRVGWRISTIEGWLTAREKG